MIRLWGAPAAILTCRGLFSSYGVSQVAGTGFILVVLPDFPQELHPNFEPLASELQ